MAINKAWGWEGKKHHQQQQKLVVKLDYLCLNSSFGPWYLCDHKNVTYLSGFKLFRVVD